MFLLEFLGTMAFLAVVSLSLLAMFDIFVPRASRVSGARRSAEHPRARRQGKLHG
ncbi:hypothetical protein BTHE68_56320 [Burkholderia sp. THE68]|uniref:hypothetical protein n=1 Tax=Burkholderiaceae TaxID=119060 RepID=UPI001315E6A1|nr:MULTISPECIES: hypothetical protein [Burkholderiaceae]BBU31898.1 hypothetical protein BTHE68_56320 [Burkholderia sp. THE68]BCQ29710.1 hypothetical protein NK8_79010 [Caballeronia sp. NK8]